MAPLDPLFEFQVHPTRASLEAPLGKDSAALDDLAAACDDGSAYRSGFMRIRGKVRYVSIPRGQLDILQGRINQVFFPLDLSLGPSPHGYITGRSTLTNARPHTGSRFLQKFDIKDFFARVTTARVEATLSELGFGAEAASILARLTSCQGALPLGARTSPRISNMVLIDLDEQLRSLALSRGLRYTRYADDLAFSSLESFDVSTSVEAAVGRLGFELNASKSRSFKHGQPMFVTGLSVEDTKRPRIRARLKSRLRQEFYYIEKFGLHSHAETIGEASSSVAGRLTGEFHYARTVEPDFAESLAQRYPTAFETVIPHHEDSKVERARRHRQEFLSEVHEAPPRSLPLYRPSVPLLGKWS